MMPPTRACSAILLVPPSLHAAWRCIASLYAALSPFFISELASSVAFFSCEFDNSPTALYASSPNKFANSCCSCTVFLSKIFPNAFKAVVVSRLNPDKS